MVMVILAFSLVTLRPLSVGLGKYWTNHQILSVYLARYLWEDEEPVC